MAMVHLARFEPARIERQVTPVWVMLPVQLSRALADNPQAPQDATQPRFTPYTKKPELLNRNDVLLALVRNYPPDLRKARIGGTVTVWLYLNTDGQVEQARVHRSSNLPELDDAALRVARIMAFSPAEHQGEKVAVWITVPVVFKTN
jgi:protein TonB